MSGGTLSKAMDPLGTMGGSLGKDLSPISGPLGYLSPGISNKLPTGVSNAAAHVFGPTAGQMTNPLGLFPTTHNYGAATYGFIPNATSASDANARNTTVSGTSLPMQRIPGGSSAQPGTTPGQQPIPQAPQLSGGFYNQMTQQLAGPSYTTAQPPYSQMFGNQQPSGQTTQNPWLQVLNGFGSRTSQPQRWGG